MSVFTVQCSVVPVEQVFDPGEDVTVYLVMAVPFVAEAVQATVALLVPAVAVGLAGAAGFSFVGLTPDDVGDAALVPTALVAVTVNLYVVPSVNPVTVQLSVASDAGEQVFVVCDVVVTL